MPSPPPLHLPSDCVLLPPANNQAAQRAQAALELARHTGNTCLLDDLALRALGRGKIGINSLLQRWRNYFSKDISRIGPGTGWSPS